MTPSSANKQTTLRPLFFGPDLPRRLAPFLAMATLVIATAVQLHRQGRILWCSCGRLNLWAGDIWSAHNSQHLLDPYSFTHILHGVLFCGIIALLFRRLPITWRLCLTIALECAWEVAENSQVIIQRYREATIGLGYEGDSIVNSMADVACCTAGFLLARKLGPRWSILFFMATELFLLFWIRDNLTLNVLMLLHPIEAVKQWQMVH